MATITFSNGTKVKFNGNPTPADVEEVAAKLGLGSVKPETNKDRITRLKTEIAQNPVRSTASFLNEGMASKAKTLSGALGISEELSQDIGAGLTPSRYRAAKASGMIRPEAVTGGSALKAAANMANLATVFVGGPAKFGLAGTASSPVRAGVQSGLISGTTTYGSALEEGDTQGEALAKGGISALLGYGMGWGSQKLAQKVAVGAPAMGGAKASKPLQESAKRLGVKLPISAEAPTSSVARRLETVTAELPASGRLTNQYNAAKEKVSLAARELVRNASDPDVVGEKVGKAFGSFVDTHNKVRNELWDAVEKGGRQINVSDEILIGLRDTLRAEAKRGSGGLGEMRPDVKYIGNLAEELAERINNNQPLTAKGLRETLLNLKSAIGYKNGGYTAVSDALDATWQDSAGRVAGILGKNSAYVAAKNQFKEGLDIIGKEWAKGITRLAKAKNYTGIAKIFESKAVDVNHIQEIRGIVGDEVMDEVRLAVMKDLLKFDKADDFVLEGVSAKFNSNLGKLQTLLSPEQFQALSDISKVSAALKAGVNPIKTAGRNFGGIVGSASALGAALMTGSPTMIMSVIGGILGNKGMDIFLTSPVGRKFLIEGILKLPQSPAASAVIQKGVPFATQKLAQ